MRFCVRWSKIDSELHDQFEQYGEQVIALVLSGPLPVNVNVHGGETKPSDAQTHVLQHQAEAKKWLMEKRDIAERHETRIELLEWAILIFLGIEVLIDVRKLIWGP